MKNKLITGMILAALLWSHTASAQIFTGQDWTQMTREEKISLVFAMVHALRGHDVKLTLSHLEYAELMDQYMMRYEDMSDERLDNLFAHMIFVADPASRPGLRKISSPRYPSYDDIHTDDRPLESYYEELGIRRDW